METQIFLVYAVFITKLIFTLPTKQTFEKLQTKTKINAFFHAKFMCVMCENLPPLSGTPNHLSTLLYTLSQWVNWNYSNVPIQFLIDSLSLPQK